LRMLNDRGLTAIELKLTPAYLAQILRLIDSSTINNNTGKSLLIKVEDSGKAPETIVTEEGLAQVSDDTAIRSVIQQLLDENPKEVAAYKSGKITLIGWFVGQVMRQMRGKADPALARKILEELLHG
jgi:aspartyl-tRNA(Asn)/glutamyl-tRNA(Gln) amidotransferase subunit B